MTYQEKTEINNFLNSAMLSQQKIFTCICDQEQPFVNQQCVLDDPKYTETDCVYSLDGQTPQTCEFWKEVTVGTFVNFFTWAGFGILWKWVNEQSWFGYMLDNMGGYFEFEEDGTMCPTDINSALSIKYVDPEMFAIELYTFLKDEEENGNKLV